jgi:protein tyrosine phosphatase
MTTTVIDFWLMIWEQQSKVVLMLTDLVENGVVSNNRHQRNGVIAPTAICSVRLADAFAGLFLWLTS